MVNNVINKLKIICTDEETMEKIKAVVFDCDKNGKKVFTMDKLLPRPKAFSDHPGYPNYGDQWSWTFWGTKWDVYDVTVKDCGGVISIIYRTASRPNDKWGKSLCSFVNKTIKNQLLNEADEISIKHQFYNNTGDFGGILVWQPTIIPKYKWYSLLDYARLHEKGLYDSLIKQENQTPKSHDYCGNKIEKKIRDQKEVIYLPGWAHNEFEEANSCFTYEDLPEEFCFTPESLFDALTNELKLQISEVKPTDINHTLITSKINLLEKAKSHFTGHELFALENSIIDEASLGIFRNEKKEIIRNIFQFKDDLNSHEIELENLLIKVYEFDDEELVELTDILISSKDIRLCVWDFKDLLRCFYK